jgi:hypothetical protein
MLLWRRRSKGHPSSGDGGGIRRQAQKIDTDFDRLYTAMGTRLKIYSAGRRGGWVHSS